MLYDSPEIINGEKYNQKSDIWSLASIFYELITKKKPFYLIENILKINYDISQIIDDDFRYIMSKILCKEGKKISLNQLFRERKFCEKIIEENLFDEGNNFKNYFLINSSDLFSKANIFKLDESNSKPFFLSYEKCHNEPNIYKRQ